MAKKLNLKCKNLSADILFPLVKDQKIQYSDIKNIDPKKFEDLEHTMRMIFNHEDGQQVTQRGIIAAAQNRLKVEKQLEEMRQREREDDGLLLKRAHLNAQKSDIDSGSEDYLEDDSDQNKKKRKATSAKQRGKASTKNKR